jgi:hypothetical protein
MDQSKGVILGILKASSVGVSPANLLMEARIGGVMDPLSVTRSLVEDGLARIDKGKNGQPDRVKALPAAWS